MKVDDRSLIPASSAIKDVKQLNEVKDAVRTAGAPASKDPAAASVRDRLELSYGVNTVRQAIEQATPSRDLRPEAVARGQALLASGALGSDLNRLADSMLDALAEGR